MIFKKPKGIYLAGSFYADNWQDKVITACKEFGDRKGLADFATILFFNPKSKEVGKDTEEKKAAADPRTYVQWDRMAIAKSDVVFVYIDKDNPACGALVEIGLAKGMGKEVILVAERGRTLYKDRYLDFARHTADVHFDTLEEGIEHLQSVLFLMST